MSVGTNIIQRKDDVYLKFNCNVKIVDMIMGSGKTTSAINYINQADPSEKFLFITPYLDEVDRIKKSCPFKNFKEPKEMGTKLNGIKHLIGQGDNIVSTHALFQRFDNEVIDAGVEAAKKLNDKYNTNKFNFVYRKRTWN